MTVTVRNKTPLTVPDQVRRRAGFKPALTSNTIWVCELTEDARKDLRDVRKAIQERISRVMMQMTTRRCSGKLAKLLPQVGFASPNFRAAVADSSDDPGTRDNSRSQGAGCGRLAR
jgi:hypothetical protein